MARAILFLIPLITLAFAQNPADNDRDGYPDQAEYHAFSQRRAFMDWFAAIAEAQYGQIATDWLPAEQDCSGLLRYAYVQALAPKSLEWFQKYPYLRARTNPPPENYPMPYILRSVFRIASGSYQLSDVAEGKLVGLANSASLMQHATVFLGRSPEVAERGDVMFYSHPFAEGSGYHSMVYLGQGMVVYHTGTSPEEGGEVRLLSLETLGKHPDPSWHPVERNPHFLGFFRWKIVD